jgi:hypothetical protein
MSIKNDFANYRVFRLGIMFAALVVVLFISFPYLQAEYYSWRYSNAINLENICKEYKQTEKLRDSKLIFYSIPQRKAEMYCFYENRDQDALLTLEKRNDWYIIFSMKTSDENFFRLPIYF